jgi:hypothetical protein
VFQCRVASRNDPPGLPVVCHINMPHTIMDCMMNIGEDCVYMACGAHTAGKAEASPLRHRHFEGTQARCLTWRNVGVASSSLRDGLRNGVGLGSAAACGRTRHCLCCCLRISTVVGLGEALCCSLWVACQQEATQEACQCWQGLPAHTAVAVD